MGYHGKVIETTQNLRVGGESKLQTSTKTYQVPNPTNVGFLYTQPHIHTQQ